MSSESEEDDVPCWSRKRPRSLFDSEDVQYAEALQREKVIKLFLLLGLCWRPREKLTRSKKTKIDRQPQWQFIESWSDQLFKRQFRMSRDDFYRLRQLCVSVYPGQYETGEENYQMAMRMGNISSSFITMEIRLCITLRLLAGASYLDMIWYGVSIPSVHSIFREVLHLINRALPASEIFGMKFDAESLNKLSSEWSAISIKKHNFDLMKGTILAGDGLVVAINAPTEEDRRYSRVYDATHFRNRKGCFGIICQAFCDAYGVFKMFEVKWPGCTNDISAYKQTSLYKDQYLKGHIPDGYHFVLDEAYSSIGGPSHMTPFSKSQLKKVKAVSEEKYFKMKAFNFCLSSQRITIERAFGMLVRKWGILWRPLEHPLATNVLVTFVCAKLHNFCLQSFLKTSPVVAEFRDIEKEQLSARSDSKVFLRWQESLETISSAPFDVEFDEDEEEEGLDDNEIMDVMRNCLPAKKRTAKCHDKKWALVDRIYDFGIRYTRDNEIVFLN